MRKLNSFLFIILFLASCGTSQKKQEANSPESLEGITNDSFKWPAPKTYQEVEDFLGQELSDSNDVLESETLAKVKEEDLEEPASLPKGLDQGIVACYKKNFALADEVFDRLLKEYIKNPIYWNQVGNCFMLKGEFRKALLYFNKARDLKSNYAPPVNNIGVIFQNKGFEQKALKSFEEAKKMASFSLTPIFNLAQLYTKYGFIEQGKTLFEALARMNQKDQDAIHGLAFLELVSGNTTGSINLYRRLDSNYIERPEVGVNYAYALFVAGNSSDASSVLGDLKQSNDGELNAYIEKVRGIVK